MRSLVSYNCSNNVGQLKNDIRIICAKAYYEFISGKKDNLQIVSLDLPIYVREGLYLETTHRKIWNCLIGINERFCIIDGSSKVPLFKSNEYVNNIYEMIDEKIQELKDTDTNEQEITKEIEDEIRIYFEKYTEISNSMEDISTISNLVGIEILKIVDQILKHANENLKIEYQNNVRYGLAVHIFNAINRIKKGHKIFNPRLNVIRSEYSREFNIALESLIKGLKCEFDLLLLVDMGSLTNFASDLENELGIRVKVIPMVSTLHVIEAGRKAVFGYQLDYVYYQTLSVNELMNDINSANGVNGKKSRRFILTICTTGEGSAKLLKNILDNHLDYHNSNCETVPLQLGDYDSILAQLSSIGNVEKILCVISSFKINLLVPQFELIDVFNGTAIPKIQKMIEDEVSFDEASDTLSHMLSNVNSREAFDIIREAIEDIESRANLKLLSDVFIGVFSHISCMLDRLVNKGDMCKFIDEKAYIQKNKKVIVIVKSSCIILEKKFSISIPDDEIYYISSFFSMENCIL